MGGKETQLSQKTMTGLGFFFKYKANSSFNMNTKSMPYLNAISFTP